MKSKKTRSDAEHVAKLFIAQIEARGHSLKCNDKFTVGFLESFLAMHSGEEMIATMKSYIEHMREGTY